MTKSLTCDCYLFDQFHAVPSDPRRLQLPGPAAGEPRPRTGVLLPLHLLRLLHPAQHVPRHHQ